MYSEQKKISLPNFFLPQTDNWIKKTTYEAYAGYAKPIRLQMKSAPYPIIKYRLRNAITPTI